MNADGKIETLKRLIENENSFIKWRIFLALLPIIIGITSSLFLLFGTDNMFSSENFKSVGDLVKTAPGLCGAAIGAFPFKDYFSQKNRIVAYDHLKLQYLQFKNDESSANPEDVKELDKRFQGLVDKYLA